MPHLKLVILFILVTSGIVLQQTGVVDFRELVDFARLYADHWWLIVLLVVLQTVLFTFAMPGSSLVWISGTLFTPCTSTLLLTAGTTLGGISAYYFSARLSVEWRLRVEDSRVYRLLREQGGFIALFALRVMPGFPHSIINYSAGILKLRLVGFTAAALAGSAVKSYVYSLLIHNATTPEAVDRSINVSTVWPLLVLSLFFLLVTLLKRYLNIR